MDICTRMVSGSDFVGGVCPSCGHNDLAHAGYPNRGDTELEGCLVCELKVYVGEIMKWMQEHQLTQGHQFTNDPIKRSDK